MPYIEQNLNKNNFNKNLNYKMPTSCSDEDFILNIYENMLKVKLRKHSEVFEFLMKKIQAGHSREKIYEALKIATSKEKEHNEKTEIKLEDFLTPGDNKGKLAVVLPKSIGDIFMATSLLPDIHNIYPEYKIYFICESQYHEILYGNPYIHKVLPFTSECHDALVLEGFSNRKDRSDFAGYFDIAILLHINNQVVLNYTRNSKDRISLDLCTC
jgi:hypothetical protein